MVACSRYEFHSIPPSGVAGGGAGGAAGGAFLGTRLAKFGHTLTDAKRKLLIFFLFGVKMEY